MTYLTSDMTCTRHILILFDKGAKKVRAGGGKSTENSPFTLLRVAAFPIKRAQKTHSMAWPLDEKWDLSH